MLAERSGDARFEAEVTRLLASVDPLRLEDVRAAAQDALIALANDPLFSDAGAEGYAPTRRQIEAGLARLQSILELVGA